MKYWTNWKINFRYWNVRQYNVKSLKFSIAWRWMIFFHKKVIRRMKYVVSKINDTYQLFGIWKPAVKTLTGRFRVSGFLKSFLFEEKVIYHVRWIRGMFISNLGSHKKFMNYEIKHLKDIISFCVFLVFIKTKFSSVNMIWCLFNNSLYSINITSVNTEFWHLWNIQKLLRNKNK